MNASVRANLIFLTLLIVPQSVVAAPQVAPEPPRWPHAHSFIQAYSRDQLYVYPAIAGRGSITKDAWAWLAPMPAELSAAGKKIERLLDVGKKLASNFQPIAPEPEVQWTKPQPDFPAALRQPQPVEDIRQVIGTSAMTGPGNGSPTRFAPTPRHGAAAC